MPTCSLGGFVSPGDTIHYTYDALSSRQSATVCSGWITRGASAALDPGAPPPRGLECTAVPPGGRHTSAPVPVGPDDEVYVIRVDYSDPADTGLLVVYRNGGEIARGTLDGCGVAIWTFDVL